jgi:hypothetical protein
MRLPQTPVCPAWKINNSRLGFLMPLSHVLDHFPVGELLRKKKLKGANWD